MPEQPVDRAAIRESLDLGAEDRVFVTLGVLNPSDATFDSLKPVLAEAYEIDRARSLRKRAGAEAGLTEG